MGRTLGDDIDGSGYAFVRSITPPGTAILPQTQSDLIEGAVTNTIAGTVGGTTIATLQFFDIDEIALTTTEADDLSGNPIISTVTVNEAGFEAFGLEKFTISGNVTYTNLAPDVQMPTDGLFEFVSVTQAAGTAPIALDLDGDGLEFVTRAAGGVTFDLKGDGLVSTAWLGADDGWLFIDLLSTEQVTRKELSFVALVPTASSDLEALRIGFDSNNDSVLSNLDNNWSDFKVWRDSDLDGVTDDGEVFTLADLDIVSINLISDDVETKAAEDQITLLGQSSGNWSNTRSCLFKSSVSMSSMPVRRRYSSQTLIPTGRFTVIG